MAKKKKSLLKLYSQAKFSKNFVIVAGLLIVAGLYFVYRSYAASPWVRMRDIRNPNGFVRAVDIGSGGGKTWAAGSDGQEYEWDGSGWRDRPEGGAAVRIDVDHLGQPWKVVWSTGNVYYRNRDDGEWHKVFSGAKDVGVSADGRGYNIVGRDGCLYKPTSSYLPYANWVRVKEVTCRIVNVDAYNGKVYFTDFDEISYEGYYGKSGFVKKVLRGAYIRDVAAGYGGKIWGVGKTATGKNFVPYQRSGSTWAKRSGGITRLTVDGIGGIAWAVNSSGFIYYYNN